MSALRRICDAEIVSYCLMSGIGCVLTLAGHFLLRRLVLGLTLSGSGV